MGYMSHWVGVSKGLCEINWKNVTHLVQGPLLFHHRRVPTGKFLSKKGLASRAFQMHYVLALSVLEVGTFCVVRLVRGKIWGTC